MDGQQSVQCPVGLLLNVDGPARRPGAVTSDLLVYGILCISEFERPPTPPVSSSPSHYDYASSVRRELRIYAAPLASSLITKAQSLPSPPRSPDTGNIQIAEFLPDFRSPSPKRKRVATLFESAAQHHQRVRQKGGEAVSQLMAHSQSQSQQHPLRIKRESEEPSALNRVQRSKSVSGSFNVGRLDLRASLSRPGSARDRTQSISRKGTPSAFAEASTQRVSSPALPSEGSGSQRDAETVIFENKHIVTRTILTCMRLYGFNRAAPRSKHAGTELDGQLEKDSSTPAPESLTAPNVEVDEFKSMYHATYRASTFALRKYLKGPTDGSQPPVLEKGKAMGYIDEFLRLFSEESRPSGTGLGYM